MRYGERQIGFYVKEELYDAVMEKVRSAPYDRSLSACMRALLLRWVRDEISIEAKHVKPPKDLRAKRY